MARSRPVLLAVATGLLLALASPGSGFSVLAWIALVPLLRGLEDVGPGRAAALGWLAGAVFAAASMSWITQPLLDHTALGSTACTLLAAAFVVLWALPGAVFAAAIAFVERRRAGLGAVLAIPLVPTLEWARGLGPLAFPWGLLGYTQPASTAASQLAEWTGVYGVSALVTAVNVAVHLGLSGLGRRARIALLTTTGIVALSLAIGTWRREVVADRGGDAIQVGLVQTDLAPRRRWTVAERAAAVESAIALSRRAARDGAALLVWAESAAPIVVAEDEVYERFGAELAVDRELRDRIRALARGLERPVLLSAAGRVAEPVGRGEAWSARNRIVRIDESGAFTAAHDKRILVPIGEIMPSPWPFADRAALTSPDLPLRPGGESPDLARAAGGPALFVCWEAIFPAFVASAASGASFLVNVTNDAWFSSQSAAEQHLAMAAFRAVENRKPLVRAANGGISAVIDVDGRIVGRGERDEATWLVAPVWPRTESTFYARFGDLFVALAALATLALLVYAGRLPPSARHAGDDGRGGDDRPEIDHAVRR